MENTLKINVMNRFEARDAKPRLFVILLVYVLLLDGSFSLGRIDPKFENLGLIGEPSTFLFLAVLLGLLAIFAFDKKPIRADLRQANAFSFLVFLIYFWMACSTIWALNQELSFEYMHYVIILVVTVMATPFIFQYRPEKSMEIFYRFCFLAAIVFAVAGIYSYSGEGRMAALTGDPNFFVRIMGTGMITSCYLWARTGKKTFLMPIPLFLSSIILSGSRGGLLASLGAFALFVAFGIKKRAAMKIKGLLIMAFLFSIFLLIGPIRQEVLYIFNQRFVDLTFEQHYMSSRDVLFSEAWDIFQNHPILGIGLNNYKVLSPTYYDYPHNFILNLASEGGIFPLIILGATAVMVIRRAFAKKNLEHSTALYLALIYFIGNNFSGGHYDTRFMWVFLVFYMLPVSRRKDAVYEKAGRSCKFRLQQDRMSVTRGPVSPDPSAADAKLA